MKATLLLPMLMLAGAPGYGQTIGHWTFDRSDASCFRARRWAFRNGWRTAGAVQRRRTGSVHLRSARATIAGQWGQCGLWRRRAVPEPLAVDIDFSRAGLAGQSITIECFVKPDVRLAAMRGWREVAGREAGAELSVEWHELQQHRQTWHGAPMPRLANGPRAGQPALFIVNASDG